MENKDSNKKTHYIHRLSYTARERLVGSFILVALLFVIALIGLNENTLRMFERTVEFQTYFRTATGLGKDTLVKVLGVDVGKVTSVTITDDNRIHAVISVYGSHAHYVRTDSVAKLNRLGVIGGATIELSAGSMDKPRLPDGALIPSSETISLDELVEGLANLVQAGNGGAGGTLLSELGEAVQHIKHFTGKVRSGEGALGTLIYGEQFHHNLDSAITLLEQVMGQASERITEVKPLVSDSLAITGNLRTVSEQLPAMVSRAGNAIDKVDLALDTLSAELHQFPDVLVRLNLVLEETTRVLEAMQRVWPISSAVRKRDGDQLIEAQPVYE